jgi:hypothetical protein
MAIKQFARISMHPNLLSPRILLRPFFPQGLVLRRERLTQLFGQRSEDQTRGVGAGDVARTVPHTPRIEEAGHQRIPQMEYLCRSLGDASR